VETAQSLKLIVLEMISWLLFVASGKLLQILPATFVP
jgi:hypothetical protein